MRLLSRLWKPLIALVALAVSFLVTLVWPRNGLDVDIDASSRAQASRNRGPYDLTQLAVMGSVIIKVKDNYVDPSRVNWKRMFLSGLNAVQRTVAPVIVQYQEGQRDLTVQVYNQRRTVRVDDINAPWKLSRRFRDVFAFLQTNLQEEDLDLRDIEYAAINGMLRTLDPHSVLLTPDVYDDMRAQTRGEFGGLGIVISMRDGQLTVVKPMPNTPASNAGLRRMDRIVKINDESTLNMPLQEAVNRLRGAPGSRVSVWVVREGQGGFTTPRRFDLVRAVIRIESVESRMLGSDIGYIKIKNFQTNTFEDTQRALAQLHRQNMRGLVLDLRDDPGGLLEQAVRVADLFLTSGTIVTTSSNDPAQREEKFATAEGTEPNYPLTVLVNGGSASASEIVAGALKNHDRALIVGQRTFGKGSVQVLYEFEDQSALKLTIAQYLTPGEVSIQGVGITPDIAIDPMTIDREDMDLTVNQEYLRESDLRAHLTHSTAHPGAQPSLVLRYYLPPDTRQRLREANPSDNESNESEDEFLTTFSRELLAHAARAGRREMLSDATPVIERARATEMQKVADELQRLGVDWTVGTDRGASDVDVQVTTSSPTNEGVAGESFELRVRVTNRGTSPLYQLRATTKSDYGLFDQRELVFGRLEPGQSREWSTTLGRCETKNQRRVCALPSYAEARADAIRVEFSEAHEHAPPTAEVRTTIRALAMPQFAYSVQIADRGRANGDGLVQRGELVTMYLRVKNIGQGRSFETEADLRNLSDRGILLRDGRFRLEGMAPNEERLIAFTFEVLPDFSQDEAKLEISVVDTALRESISERVVVPIAGTAAAAPTARTGQVLARPNATLRESPAANAKVVAEIRGGTLALPAQAELNGFVRVDMGQGRPAWLAAAEVANSAGAPGTIAESINHMPPRLDVNSSNTLVTRATTLALTGNATDERIVRDAYIFVGAQKVFYQSNRGTTDAHQLAFTTNVPLRPGINYIYVFAREDNEVISRKLLVVRRDAPDGSIMQTPPFDRDEFSGEADDALMDE